MYDASHHYRALNGKYIGNKLLYSFERHGLDGLIKYSYPYSNNPMRLCDEGGSLFMGPMTNEGKRYGYLVCDKVIKFDLLTGVVLGTYLENITGFGVNQIAFHGNYIWASGQYSY